MPTNTNIAISNFDSDDFSEIINISDHCFGNNFITVSKLNQAIINSGICLKLLHKGKLVGFSFASNLSIIDLKTIYNINSSVNDAFILQTVAIHPKFQRKGYGTQLVLTTTNCLKNSDKISYLYYPAWDEPKSKGFIKALQKNGFREYKKIGNFWFADSLKKNYKCSICGSPPCTCTMILFKRELQEGISI